MDTQTDPITGSLNDEYLDYGDMATQTNVSMANNGGRLGDTVLVDVGTQTETSFQAELYKIKGLIDKALLILAQGEIRWNEIEAAEGKLRDILELLGVGAGGGAGGAGGGGSGGGSGGGGEEA